MPLLRLSIGLFAALLVIASTITSGAFGYDRASAEIRQTTLAVSGLRLADICGSDVADHGDCPLCRLLDEAGQAVKGTCPAEDLRPMAAVASKALSAPPRRHRPTPPLRAPPFAPSIT
ncbi:MAG: hypothetical protein AAF264_10225 [Pseudomonadota bacterium]